MILTKVEWKEELDIEEPHRLYVVSEIEPDKGHIHTAIDKFLEDKNMKCVWFKDKIIDKDIRLGDYLFLKDIEIPVISMTFEEYDIHDDLEIALRYLKLHSTGITSEDVLKAVLSLCEKLQLEKLDWVIELDRHVYKISESKESEQE